MRILGIGDNTVDIYVDRGVRFPGGNAVNVAVLAGRLGAEAGYLGCLGDDAYGDFIEECLRAEGLDLTRLRRIAGPNPWCRIRHEGSDRIFAGSIPGVRGQYGFENADERYIASFDLAHTSISSDIDFDLPLLRRNAPLLSYDYSESWRRVWPEATLAEVDLAFLSFPGGSDEECAALIGRAFEAGVSTATIVTRGPKGSMAGHDGRVFREAIRPARVVDTLGAGDAFIAAFLVSFLAQRDPAAALARGAENAALACAQDGAFGHGRPVMPDDPAPAAMPAAAKQ